MKLSEPFNRRRSQRVPLQVVVLIRANMPDGRCVQVQAFTSVVNAHGGLLESPMELRADQKIVLVNPHSRNEVSCRVVQVERPKSTLYEVAFEFDLHSARFWQIDLAPEDWATQKESASENP